MCRITEVEYNASIEYCHICMIFNGLSIVHELKYSARQNVLVTKLIDRRNVGLNNAIHREL
jgi:hypothetical protein